MTTILEMMQELVQAMKDRRNGILQPSVIGPIQPPQTETMTVTINHGGIPGTTMRVAVELRKD